MGTNYYYKLNECTHCKRFEEIHIGKSSAGWKFTFQANGRINSFEMYREELQDKDIYNEYGDEIILAKLLEIINSKQNLSSHSAEYPEGNFMDKDGYEFSTGVFS